MEGNCPSREAMGGVEKCSEWERDLLTKINGERMIPSFWEIPVCGSPSVNGRA